MRLKVNFGNLKWVLVAVLYLSEMVRNAIQSDFWTSKMAAGGNFLKNIYKKTCVSDFNNVRTDYWLTTT